MAEQESNAEQSDALNDPVAVVLEQVKGMAEGFVAHLPQLAIALVVLLLTWAVASIVSRLATRALSRLKGRRSLQVFFRKLINIGIWVAGIFIAAVVIFPSITPSTLLAGLGLGSVAIGFAFKDIFENFLAGMLILAREPFSVGDFIECEDYEGFVDEITIRDTRLRQTDGQPVIMPNAMLFKNPVTVRTAKERRRVMVVCGVGYGEDVAESRSVIENAMQGLDTVDSGKPVQVFAREFGASSVDFEIAWWTESSPLEVRRSKDQVIEAVKRALDDADIEIPFPYRTLTFSEPLTVDGQRELQKERAGET